MIMKQFQVITINQVNSILKSKAFHLSVMQNSPGLIKSIGQFFILAGFLLCATLLMPAPSFSENELPDSHTQILKSANDYLIELTHKLSQQQTGNFSHTLSPPNSKIELTKCQNPLSVQRLSQRTSGRITLKISCSKPKNWSIHIPAKIKHTVEIIVSARPVNRGEILSKQDISTQEISAAKIRHGYYFDSTQLIGLQLKRSLAPNTPIKPNHLTEPVVIKKGEPVLITADIKSLKVRSSGTALSDGVVGQIIRVKNRKSKRIIEATVSGPGRVKIRL